MTVVPPARASTVDFYEMQTALDQLIATDDGRRVSDFLQSGAYELYTALNTVDASAFGDLLSIVVNGATIHRAAPGLWPSAKFRAEAFQAFIDDGRVFMKPYGMLSVLYRAWMWNPQFYLIIVSLIPDETWRQMATLLLQRATQQNAFTLPDAYRPLLMRSVARWGRHAITLAQHVELQRRIAQLRETYNIEIWDETARAIDLRNDIDEPLRTALRRWFIDARRRICYRELTHFMLAVINTHFPDEVLIQMARFAFPCYDYTEADFDRTRAISRSDVVGIITRVREAWLKRNVNAPRATSEPSAHNL